MWGGTFQILNMLCQRNERLEVNVVGEKDFSEGFLHDIADLIDMCSKEGTDNIELTFEAAGKKLCIEMTFSLKDEDEDF